MSFIEEDIVDGKGDAKGKKGKGKGKKGGGAGAVPGVFTGVETCSYYSQNDLTMFPDGFAKIMKNPRLPPLRWGMHFDSPP